MAVSGHCTCRSGRDYDGSEFGPCEYCERMTDEDRARKAMLRDAARWRISQITYQRLMDTAYGYFCVGEPVLGEGKTEGAAIDDMFMSLAAYAQEGGELPRHIAAVLDLVDAAKSDSPNDR